MRLKLILPQVFPAGIEPSSLCSYEACDRACGADVTTSSEAPSRPEKRCNAGLDAPLRLLGCPPARHYAAAALLWYDGGARLGSGAFPHMVILHAFRQEPSPFSCPSSAFVVFCWVAAGSTAMHGTTSPLSSSSGARLPDTNVGRCGHRRQHNGLPTLRLTS